MWMKKDCKKTEWAAIFYSRDAKNVKIGSIELNSVLNPIIMIPWRSPLDLLTSSCCHLLTSGMDNEMAFFSRVCVRRSLVNDMMCVFNMDASSVGYLSEIQNQKVMDEWSLLIIILSKNLVNGRSRLEISLCWHIFLINLIKWLSFCMVEDAERGSVDVGKVMLCAKVFYQMVIKDVIKRELENVCLSKSVSSEWFDVVGAKSLFRGQENFVFILCSWCIS